MGHSTGYPLVLHGWSPPIEHGVLCFYLGQNMANQFSKPFPISDDDLRELCLIQKMSQSDIAKKYGIGQSSVSRHLRSIGLGGARNFDDRSGENNSNWKGVCKTPCAYCGESLGDKAYDDAGRKFCNRKCYHLHRTEESTVTTACHTCGKTFSYNTHKERNRRFCSRACAGANEDNRDRIGRIHRGKTIPEWHRQAVSKARSKRNAETDYTSGRNGHHDSPKAGNIFYRSSYEQVAYQLLDNDTTVTHYRPEPFVISYINPDGNARRYRPDILIEKDGQTLLVEVKPQWKLSDAITQLKIEAGKQYATEKGWTFEVWTETELGI